MRITDQVLNPFLIKLQNVCRQILQAVVVVGAAVQKAVNMKKLFAAFRNPVKIWEVHVIGMEMLIDVPLKLLQALC